MGAESIGRVGESWTDFVMSFAIRHRELLPMGTQLEFDKLLKFLKPFLLKEHNEDGTHITSTPTSGVASNALAYVTIGNTSDLSAERSLVGTSNQITVTDNGAGSTVVIATPQNIATTSSPTFTAVTLSGLTSGRVPIAGSGGLIGDDADLTFATDTLTATKLVGTTSVTTAALTDSGLTSGRVVLAGTGGLLGDDADLTFATDTLTATKVVGTTSVTTAALTDSGLTSGRIVLATTGGLLTDDADLTFLTDTLTAKGLVVGTTKLTSYNSITTAGLGIPVITGSGRSTAQTAAVASVATFTVGASDASFLVSANVLVTTSTSHSFTVTCAYTDEGNTARTLTLTFSSIGGTLLTAITDVTGAGPYEGIPLHIRAKTATAITIATTGTFTTLVYNVEGLIQQVA